jgi:hypothetical protein
LEVFEKSDPVKLNKQIFRNELGLLGKNAFCIPEWSKVAENELIHPVELPREVLIAADSKGDEKMENLQLLNDILENIIQLGNQASAEFGDVSKTNIDIILTSPTCTNLILMWNIFRENYLARFFPQVCRMLSVPIKNGDGYEMCPANPLELLVEFLETILTPNEETKSLIQEGGAVLKAILLHVEENREIVLEIIRQCLMTKMDRKGLHLINCFFSAFGASFSNEKQSELASAFNPFLDQISRRFVNCLYQSILECEAKFTNKNESISRALLTFRTIASEKQFKISEQTWYLLMEAVLDIQEKVLIRSNYVVEKEKTKYSERLVKELADTCLGIWLRNPFVAPQFWINYAHQFEICREIPHYVTCWVILIEELSFHLIEKTGGFAPRIHKDGAKAKFKKLATAASEDGLAGKDKSNPTDKIIGKSTKEETISKPLSWPKKDQNQDFTSSKELVWNG